MQTHSKLDTVDEKYQRTIIYGIVCMITKEKYVGSTILTLEKRIADHIRQRSCSAWQILERGNYRAYVIQHYPCNTKRERLVREGMWQRAYKKRFGEKLVNKQVEGTFQNDNPEAKRAYDRQYYDEHREEIQARDRQYYDEHREEIQARSRQQWTCEYCNITITRGSKSRHKRISCKLKPVVHEAQKGC